MNAPKPTRIPPHVDGVTEVLPPCGGTWHRDDDGGLTPGDASTAAAAGLDWAPAPIADARTTDIAAE